MDYKTKTQQVFEGNGKLFLENKTKPTVTHGVKIWSVANANPIQHLQTEANKMIMIAANTPW